MPLAVSGVVVLALQILLVVAGVSWWTAYAASVIPAVFLYV